MRARVFIDGGAILANGKTDRVAYLDGLRGLAALAVFLIHSGGLGLRQIGLGTIADFGRYGVVAFFVLSAYTLTMRAAAGGSWRDYALRRFLRIAPLYYLVCIAAVLVHPDMLSSLAPHLTFANIFMLQHVNDLVYVEWSIAVEVAFYVLFPFIFLAARSRAGLCILLVAALVTHIYRDPIALRVLSHFDDRGFTVLWHFAEFIVGMAAARIATPWMRSPWALVGIAFAAAFTLRYGEDFWTSLLIAFITGAVILHCASSGVLARALAWSPLRYVGRISYSVYLLHFPVLFAAWNYLPKDSILAGFVALTATIALASLTYRYVEQPFISKYALAEELSMLKQLLFFIVIWIADKFGYTYFVHPRKNRNQSNLPR